MSLPLIILEYAIVNINSCEGYAINVALMVGMIVVYVGVALIAQHINFMNDIVLVRSEDSTKQLAFL